MKLDGLSFRIFRARVVTFDFRCPVLLGDGPENAMETPWMVGQVADGVGFATYFGAPVLKACNVKPIETNACDQSEHIRTSDSKLD